MLFVFFVRNIIPLLPSLSFAIAQKIKEGVEVTKIIQNLPAVCLQSNLSHLAEGFLKKIWQDEATTGLENNVANKF